MMLLIGFEGPLEQWQAEMRKLSRSGMQALVETLAFTRMAPADHMLTLVRQAKREGRWHDAHRQSQRLLADPKAFLAASRRRSQAAKKAARRRKRASR